MKIKTKLYISFCIIIFVPILLAAVVLFGFQNIQMRAIEKTYGIKDADGYSLTTSVQLLNRLTQENFEELQRIVRTASDKLENNSYLVAANQELKEKYSYLVVIKGENIIFYGGDDKAQSVSCLLDKGQTDSKEKVSTYMDENENILVKQVDFAFSDGEAGSAYIVTSTNNIMPEMRRIVLEAAIAVIAILIFTAIMMCIWINQSMITPIRKLQLAAENIKEGNLDFEIDVSGEDEIGELGITFEKMRQHLKDNAEEKIRNEKENRTLISNIAHDLKTPITAVKGYAEGILDGVANTPEKVDKYVRTIYNKANEMDLLINELTLYSKIDTNRIPYNFAKINVVEYFNDCVEEIGLDLEAKGIGLAYYNYTEENTLIIADPEQLRRVINNIIGNSVKYMNKQNGFINIRVKDVGDFIQMEIEDNGRGIAQKDLPFIFDRFYRADASRNSATGGSGIGLSIVKKIVEDHGGKIWATSKEDTGTIMYVVIRKYQEVPNE